MQMEYAFAKVVVPVNSKEVTLYIGNEVFHLLEDAAFQVEWDALYQNCSWATVFQSRGFVSTWYHVYRSEYLPIVVASKENGKLTGLLTMAKGEGHVIVGAGESQAEYQVWIATSSEKESFIQTAISKIRKHFPKEKIQFKYIPAGASLDWVKQDAHWRKYGILRTFEQPLLRIDEENISNELRKKNRREKINRLKRMGKLEFECITDVELFSSLFDHLALQSDFRKAAMFNKTFFITDTLRKEFLIGLFKQGLLHTSVLKLNNEVIASNVSVAGKNWVHLQGINSHDPCYSRYSPGILHFLMLGKQLSTEGVETFDFTPGTHSYKDALATDYTQAHTLIIGSLYNQLASNIKFGLIRSFKKGASRVGIQLDALKKFKGQIQLYKDKLKNISKQGITAFKDTISLRNKLLPKSKKNKTQSALQHNGVENISINRNHLSDLLAFESRGTWQSRWEFLKQAMYRLETGQTAYTWFGEGRLLACAWLNVPKATSNADSATHSPTSAQLERIYCHPLARPQLAAFVGVILRQIAHDQPGAAVCVAVTNRDHTLCKALESLGFNTIS